MDDALVTTAKAYEEGLQAARKRGFYCGILVTIAVSTLWKKYQEQKQAAEIARIKP